MSVCQSSRNAGFPLSCSGAERRSQMDWQGGAVRGSSWGRRKPRAGTRRALAQSSPAVLIEGQSSSSALGTGLGRQGGSCSSWCHAETSSFPERLWLEPSPGTAAGKSLGSSLRFDVLEVSGAALYFCYFMFVAI